MSANTATTRRLHTRVLVGLQAHPVSVECNVGAGLPSTTIVGLAEGAVREARDRVKTAITNSGFTYPDGQVVINLAPGSIAKTSPGIDLPIALSILVATKQIDPSRLDHYEFLGELSLFGELRWVHGALACALSSVEAGRMLLVPMANLPEASIAPKNAMGMCGSLLEVASVLNGTQKPAPGNKIRQHRKRKRPHLFDQVIGQQAAKRALSIAAAGGHHALMVGPPGTGKTMLARAFTELLPPLTENQRLEVAALYSAAGISVAHLEGPPFRDPHHSASATALVGGGNPPMPGEVALAHHGVLFLDEVPHFKPSALNLLREPIETGKAIIARAKYNITYPCRFQLIAAMNPCPAGRTCNEHACRCTSAQVQRYQGRISGPMLDRIDIHIPVPELPKAVLAKLDRQQESLLASSVIEQVHQARAIQMDRQGCINASLDNEAVRKEIETAHLDSTFLQQAIDRYKLSARSYQKLWRLGRTIADLERAPTILLAHLTEAMSYRAIDWESMA